RVSVLPLIEHLQRFAPCCLLAVVDFAQVQNLPLCYFPRLQTPTFHHRVIAVFLPVLDPRIAAQKHSQFQNARNCPPCIEGRSPLQALAKMFCSAQMTCRDDSPTFRPKSVSTAKVGLESIGRIYGTCVEGKANAPRDRERKQAVVPAGGERPDTSRTREGKASA